MLKDFTDILINPLNICTDKTNPNDLPSGF